MYPAYLHWVLLKHRQVIRNLKQDEGAAPRFAGNVFVIAKRTIKEYHHAREYEEYASGNSE